MNFKTIGQLTFVDLLNASKKSLCMVGGANLSHSIAYVKTEGKLRRFSENIKKFQVRATDCIQKTYQEK